MRRFFYFFWALALPVLLMVSLIPDFMPMTIYSDKMLHVSVFCLFLLGPALSYQRWRYVFLLASLLFAAGVFLEIVQSYIPRRESSLDDMIANGTGVLLGLTIGYLLRSGYRGPNNRRGMKT
jgi:VanZ family protein